MYLNTHRNSGWSQATCTCCGRASLRLEFRYGKVVETEWTLFPDPVLSYSQPQPIPAVYTPPKPPKPFSPKLSVLCPNCSEYTFATSDDWLSSNGTCPCGMRLEATYKNGAVDLHWFPPPAPTPEPPTYALATVTYQPDPSVPSSRPLLSDPLAYHSPYPPRQPERLARYRVKSPNILTANAAVFTLSVLWFAVDPSYFFKNTGLLMSVLFVIVTNLWGVIRGARDVELISSKNPKQLKE